MLKKYHEREDCDTLKNGILQEVNVNANDISDPMNVLMQIIN